MLINLSNHPYADWDEKQRKAATVYGEVVDMPFPVIDAQGDEMYIAKLVNDYELKIDELARHNQVVVHVMGEMSFCLALVTALQKKEISCIVSTSKRNSIKLDNGHKQIRFEFVRFRKYHF